MFVVGLTGGIGSGKSEVARLFAAHGVTVVDTDAIAHQLTAPGQPAVAAIREVFGDAIIDAAGGVDRRMLRARVFSDAQARRTLEGILHPMIRTAARDALQSSKPEHYAMLVVPLLFETQGYREQMNRTLVVDCDESQQIQRAMARSGLSESEVHAIMAAQCSRETRLRQADDVIENRGTLEELAEKVAEQHQKYIQACMVRQSIS